MSDEFDFEPRLGKIGHRKSAKPKPFVRQVLDVAYKSGFKTRRTSSFTGQRIGRGAAWGTLASAGLMRTGGRKAVVKVRIAKLRSGNLAAPRAHLRYIQRDGVDQNGEPGKLYGPELDEVDSNVFTVKCDGDRHLFRIIVSPDDGEQLAELKPFVRDLMQQMERDLETKLDWVAVDHYNTGHPHTHIVIRGKAEDGKDLIMARDYVTHGIRQRAGQLLTMELGPEIEFDKQLKLAREVNAERFTNLDKSILKHVDQGILTVSAMPPTEPYVHTSHMRRLKHLSNFGLATELQTGVWEIDPDIERKLRSLGKHNDIIATMHRAMREAKIDRPGVSFAIFDSESATKPVIGRVAAIGLTDEINDRHFVVVDGIDGKVHYADIGRVKPEALPSRGMIVSLEGPPQEAATQGTQDKQRARLRVLSYVNLERLAGTEGLTWLDRELASKSPVFVSDQGFGKDVKSALRNRLQWLTERRMVEPIQDGGIRPTTTAMKALANRELEHAAQQLTTASGLHAARLMDGERFEGTYRQPISLASGKFAVFENSKEFTLVPWRPSFEDIRGKEVIGKVNGSTFAWELAGRSRGLGILNRPGIAGGLLV
jgi:type IV secretory pathway VirD2 relaxase